MKNREEEQSVESILEQADALDVKDVRRSRRLRRRILFGVIILSVVCAVSAVLILTLCKVGEITAEAGKLYRQEELIAAMGIQTGENLFSFRAGDVAKKIEREYPYLKDVQVQRHLPSRVHLSFREVLGDMCIKFGDEYYPIDQGQTVLKRCDSPRDGETHRITLISGHVSRCVVGEKLEYTDSSLFRIVDGICRAVDENGVLDKIDTIDLSNKFDVVMDFDSRFEIRLGSTENLKYKIAMVIKVVSELEPDDRGEIDVSETSTAYVKLYNK